MNRSLPTGCARLSGACDCPTCLPEECDIVAESLAGPYLCGGCGVELTSSLDCPDRCHIRINAETNE